MGVFNNVFFFNVYFETESHCSPGLTGTLVHPALNPKMLCLYCLSPPPAYSPILNFGVCTEVHRESSVHVDGEGRSRGSQRTTL